MGSYQQTIVGGILLVTAFVFGRYVMNHPPGSKSIAKTGETEILRLQAETGPSDAPAASDSNALQRSLRDRILGERAVKSTATASNALPSKPEVQAENPSTPPAKLAEQPVVVPDFSHLEPESPQRVLSTDAEPQRLPAREIAVAEKPADFEIAGQSDPSPKFGKELAEIGRTDQEGNQINQARFSIDQKPKSDSITHRGVVNIRELESKMIPVQRKQSQLILQNREFVDYTTVFGDTLHSLSTKFFGSPEFYLDIYLANRDLLQNPSVVPVNTTIKIPVMRTADKASGR